MRYVIGPLENCIAEFHAVHAETEQNRQDSLNIVRASAENFGGQGADAFQQAIHVINTKYDSAIQKLRQVPIAVESAKSGGAMLRRRRGGVGDAPPRRKPQRPV